MGLLDPQNWAARFGSDAPVTTGLLAPYPNQPANGLLAPHPEALSAYQPSAREMVQGWIAGLLGGGRKASQQADQVMSLLNLTPAGAPLTAYDAGRTLGGGLYRGSPTDTARGLLDLAGAGVQAAPAGLFGVDNALARLAEPAEQAASRSVSIYNPPVIPQRDFALDYPNGAAADATGRLTADTKGRPLTANWIAGRTTSGGADNAIPEAQLDAIATAITGNTPASAPLRRGTAGEYRKSPITQSDFDALSPVQQDGHTGFVTGILLNNKLSAGDQPMVLAHEIGHAISDAAGDARVVKRGDRGRPIPFSEISLPADAVPELRQVYSDLNGGKQPEDFRYRADDVHSELLAEAVRAYMANPNYLKAIAPNTAAAIRDAVNSNPQLMKIIQFNGLAGLLAGSAAQQQQNSDQ